MSGGEMVVQTERENSSDGSNGKMTEMVSGKRCWLFEMFRAGGGVFCLGEVMDGMGRCGGNLCGDRDIGKCLGEIFSGIGNRYDGRFLHQK